MEVFTRSHRIASPMDSIANLSNDPRVTVRSPGDPNPKGLCVVYWMQRAQRGIDNPALDVAVEAAEGPSVVEGQSHADGRLHFFRTHADGDVHRDLHH